VLKDISERKERSLRRYLMKYSDKQKSALMETLREILEQTTSERP
jgi:hypothetical protein